MVDRYATVVSKVPMYSGAINVIVVPNTQRHYFYRIATYGALALAEFRHACWGLAFQHAFLSRRMSETAFL